MVIHDLKRYPSVTWEEAEEHFSDILERLNVQKEPFVICKDDVPCLILMEWEDYWERFGSLKPPGERERIEAACRAAWEKQQSCGEVCYRT